MDCCLDYEEVEHFVRVPVRVGDRAGRFLVDSGAGITVVSPEFAHAVGAEELGTSYSGQRMSGQEVSAPLVRLPSLSVGCLTVADHQAGRIGLGPVDKDRFFDGILGLDFFADTTLTVDPSTRTVTIADNFAVGASALVMPVDVEADGTSVGVFARLVLPSGRVVKVEVDTGSQAVILDRRFMPDCAVDPKDPALNTRAGVDETGYEWIRTFTTIDGPLYLHELPGTALDRPQVLFQDIIHEGLLGTLFLNRFRHTFDVRGKRMVLEPI